MSDSEIAIKVDGVYKDFKLPHEKAGSVKNVFTNMLHTISASRTYTEQHALRDINFEIKKGEFFGIVGRNGSGKSTLLKIIAGIYQPTKGNVTVKGKLVPFIELGVGFNAELTGRENVYLNGALLGFSKKEIDAMYESIVDFAELEKFMDQKLKNYSSGMQVRLAFSMAIRAEADILLIDEVLAVGDADFQRKCFDYFKKLKKAKKTVVFVSHDMDAIREYCDKAVLINENHIVATGSADSIAQAYNKLFMDVDDEEESDDVVTGDDMRWGDGRVKYTNITLSTNKLDDTTNELTVRVKALAHKDTADPIFGIAIKDSAGVPVFGTNTHIKAMNIKKISEGEEISLEWKIPNIFSPGIFYINPAIVHSSGFKTSDWWEEAAKFNVFSEEKTPYPVNPRIKVSISNEK